MSVKKSYVGASKNDNITIKNAFLTYESPSPYSMHTAEALAVLINVTTSATNWKKPF